MSSASDLSWGPRLALNDKPTKNQTDKQPAELAPQTWRCEPTFRSCETPALLVPKQRYMYAQCRADLGQGDEFPITTPLTV